MIAYSGCCDEKELSTIMMTMYKVADPGFYFEYKHYFCILTGYFSNTNTKTLNTSITDIDPLKLDAAVFGHSTRKSPQYLSPVKDYRYIWNTYIVDCITLMEIFPLDDMLYRSASVKSRRALVVELIWILSGSPDVSIREAKLMVSPNKQNLGILLPMTPPTVCPE